MCDCVSSGSLAGIIVGVIFGTLLVVWLVCSVGVSVRSWEGYYSARSSVRGRRMRDRRGVGVGAGVGKRVYVGVGGGFVDGEREREFRVKRPEKVYYTGD